jgi:hypothetical protein
MPVTDVWADWSTTAASNSPAGGATPEIDDELRNVKAQVKANAVTLTGDQTIAGVKTLSSIPLLPNSNPTTALQAVKASTIQSNVLLSGTAGGTGDNLTLALTPTLGAYAAGQLFCVVLSADNTGAATLQIEALGAKDIKKRASDGTLAALVATDLKNGQTILLSYDGNQFVLINTRPTVEPSACSQADQETGSEAAKYVAPATQQYHPSAAKFFGHVTYSGGTPTLQAGSYNVASIHDDAEGVLTVTFSTAFSSIYYASFAIAHNSTTDRVIANIRAQATGSITFGMRTDGGSAIDPVALTFGGFGDQ